MNLVLHLSALGVQTLSEKAAQSAQAQLNVDGPGALIWPVLAQSSAAPIESEGHGLVADTLL